jgi:Secretion system C-terminal sorting domain
VKKNIILFLLLSIATSPLVAQTTCNLFWLNNTNPSSGSLNNTFFASSTNIMSRWETTNPSFGSFSAGRPSFSSFANTLLQSARGGGFGAKTTIVFSSPVDLYRLQITDLRGDGFTSESQKIEAYNNHIAVGRVYSTTNATLVTINTSTNTISGSSITTGASQGEVMVSFTGPVDSLVVKSVGNSDFIFVNLLCPDGVQSVNMSSLKGEVIANQYVNLNWQTYKEFNNKGFAVQRSADGILFETIGFINGKNNSNQLVPYSYTDYNPNFGTSYYRLIQTNFDGGYTLSETVLVKLNATTTIFYDNFNKRVVVALPNQDNTILSIFNSSGALLLQQKCTSPLEIIPTRNMTSGIYYLKIENSHKSIAKKIVIE